MSYCTAHETLLMVARSMCLTLALRCTDKSESAKLELKDHPAGQGMLNTVTRAERIAILNALPAADLTKTSARTREFPVDNK